MKTLMIILTLLLLVEVNVYLYVQGTRDGEQRYKQSHRMYLALKSAYHFGYMDCHDGKPEDWDGE